MKSYKSYKTIDLGCSDIASLTIRNVCDLYPLSFGEDKNYSAYLVDEDAEIGAHYKKVYSFTGEPDTTNWSGTWIWIYDDEQRVYKSPRCKEINIYRSGDFGCIIQLVQASEE